MADIYCAEIECKYRSDYGTCSKDKIHFSSIIVNTVNRGRVDMNNCRDFEESEETTKLLDFLKEKGLGVERKRWD